MTDSFLFSTCLATSGLAFIVASSTSVLGIFSAPLDSFNVLESNCTSSLSNQLISCIFCCCSSTTFCFLLVNATVSREPIMPQKSSALGSRFNGFIFGNSGSITTSLTKDLVFTIFLIFLTLTGALVAGVDDVALVSNNNFESRSQFSILLTGIFFAFASLSFVLISALVTLVFVFVVGAGVCSFVGSSIDIIESQVLLMSVLSVFFFLRGNLMVLFLMSLPSVSINCG